MLPSVYVRPATSRPLLLAYRTGVIFEYFWVTEASCSPLFARNTQKITPVLQAIAFISLEQSQRAMFERPSSEREGNQQVREKLLKRTFSNSSSEQG